MEEQWISPFWQAFSQPAQSRVCGLRVSPLTVWHVFALEQIDNTYMVGGVLDVGDALQLLTVATQTRDQFLRSFHNPSKRRRIVERCRRAMIRAAWKRKTSAVLQCKEYVDQSMRVAGRWIKKEAKPCAVPHALHILAAAIRFGVPYEKAWDMPYCTARAMFDVLAERNGDDSIQTAAAQQLDEKMHAEEMEARNG